MALLQCSQCDWKAGAGFTGRHCHICGGDLEIIAPPPTPAVDRASVDSVFSSYIERILQSQNPNREVSPSDVKKIATLVVDARKAALVDIALTLDSVTLPLVLGSFSHIPTEPTTIKGQLCLGNPIFGDEDLIGDSYEGKIVVFHRGKVSFAKKYMAAKRAGASAVIVVQSENYAWPFLMTDSSNEVAALSGQEVAELPVAMISSVHADLLQKYISGASSKQVHLTLAVVHADECSICRDGFAEGQSVLKLDCRHCYHADCLSGWLQRSHTCPLCRQSILQTTRSPTDHGLSL